MKDRAEALESDTSGPLFCSPLGSREWASQHPEPKGRAGNSWEPQGWRWAWMQRKLRQPRARTPCALLCSRPHSEKPVAGLQGLAHWPGARPTSESGGACPAVGGATDQRAPLHGCPLESPLRRAGTRGWFSHGCLGCVTQQMLRCSEHLWWGKTPGEVHSQPQGTTVVRTPRALGPGHAYTAENYSNSTKRCCWTLRDRKCLTTGTEWARGQKCETYQVLVSGGAKETHCPTEVVCAGWAGARPGVLRGFGGKFA